MDTLVMLVLKITALWLAFTTLTVATGWFLVVVVKLRWPDWWQRVMAEEVSQFERL
jgi:hypothetical protein